MFFFLLLHKGNFKFLNEILHTILLLKIRILSHLSNLCNVSITNPRRKNCGLAILWLVYQISFLRLGLKISFNQKGRYCLSCDIEITIDYASKCIEYKYYFVLLLIINFPPMGYPLGIEALIPKARYWSLVIPRQFYTRKTPIFNIAYL